MLCFARAVCWRQLSRAGVSGYERLTELTMRRSAAAHSGFLARAALPLLRFQRASLWTSTRREEKAGAFARISTPSRRHPTACFSHRRAFHIRNTHTHTHTHTQLCKPSRVTFAIPWSRERARAVSLRHLGAARMQVGAHARCVDTACVLRGRDCVFARLEKLYPPYSSQKVARQARAAAAPRRASRGTVTVASVRFAPACGRDARRLWAVACGRMAARFCLCALSAFAFRACAPIAWRRPLDDRMHLVVHRSVVQRSATNGACDSRGGGVHAGAADAASPLT
jgi:hypothetical protein